MQLARVVGTVVATQRDITTQGWIWRVVEHITDNNQATGQYTIAVDVLGTNEGEVVLITTGSAARQTHDTAARPCDAVIMAIVDTWAVGDDVRYHK